MYRYTPPKFKKQQDNNRRDKALINMQDSIAYFKKEYPDGFNDKKYLYHERDYKLKFHRKAQSLLNKKDFKNLLQKKEYDEIFNNLKKIFVSVNLIDRYTKDNFKKALNDFPDEKNNFIETLYKHLYSNETLENRFNMFIDFFGKLKNKTDFKIYSWPMVSYFGFIFLPEELVFIMKTKIEHAADLCNYEISYDSSLNWETYDKSKNFYKDLKLKLEKENLFPKDMIDIQSFIWLLAERNKI